HSVRLAGQVVLQMPETHCSPAPHLVPQAPQFAESRLTSMQLPLQLVRPVRHSIAQRPAPPPAGGVHTWPAGQVAPQAPQLVRSLDRSLQMKALAPGTGQAV